MNMVSVCLPSDALSQHLLSYLCFSYLLLPWGISSRLLRQSAATAPYLGWGVSPHSRPSWPSMRDGSSRPSWAQAATAPWRSGWSSRPPPLAWGMGLLLPATALGLGRGVAPLGHSCAVTAWHSQLPHYLSWCQFLSGSDHKKLKTLLSLCGFHIHIQVIGHLVGSTFKIFL